MNLYHQNDLNIFIFFYSSSFIYFFLDLYGSYQLLILFVTEWKIDNFQIVVCWT